MLEEGDKAPNFTLPTDGNGTIQLSQFKGNPVVIYFYPKDDTSGCTKEAISFTELYNDFIKIKVPIIGISPDSVTKHDKFKSKYDLKITLAADDEKKVVEAYGVWVEKSMYGRKYMGVERSTFLIDALGKIARIWRKVKVPGHADQVLKAVQSL